MTTYLLDSNHASTLVTPGHHVRARFTKATDAGHVFHVILPVITETVFGFSILPRAAQNERLWRAIRRTLVIVGMDEMDALDAANMQVNLRRHGWQLGTVDALTAIAALRYDLVLLTTDRDFAPVPGLTTENWVAN